MRRPEDAAGELVASRPHLFMAADNGGEWGEWFDGLRAAVAL